MVSLCSTLANDRPFTSRGISRSFVKKSRSSTYSPINPPLNRSNIPTNRRHHPCNSSTNTLASSSQTPTGTGMDWITLPDGMRLEAITLKPQSPDPSKPILLFVHGSYHGAWCFSENFLPFFSDAGYESISISLRAQGNSDRGNLKISGDLQSHACDLASVLKSLPRPAVVIGHSFGGLLVTKYATLLDTQQQQQQQQPQQQPSFARPSVAGIALLCSVPPSGNKDIVVRITKKSFLESMKITWAFVTKSFARSLDSCRDTFFSQDIPLEKLEKYQKMLAECSPVRLLDLSTLNKELPLPPVSFAGKRSTAGVPAVFVGGGVNDRVVDMQAVMETAEYFGVEPVFWDRMAHDCMLDTRWEETAQSLKEWLTAQGL